MTESNSISYSLCELIVYRQMYWWIWLHVTRMSYVRMVLYLLLFLMLLELNCNRWSSLSILLFWYFRSIYNIVILVIELL